MNKKLIPVIEWYEETGIATCEFCDIYDRVHFGAAQCHEHDEDMKSEKTGIEIAKRRAEIEALKSYVRDELKPRLRALKQLYYSMNRSKYFNPKSYETKMLWSQIRLTKNELATTKEIIAELEESLMAYIDKKDDFYKKVRCLRRIQQAEDAAN